MRLGTSLLDPTCRARMKRRSRFTSAHRHSTWQRGLFEDTISRIPERVAAELAEWASGPLDPLHPVMFVDAGALRCRDRLRCRGCFRLGRFREAVSGGATVAPPWDQGFCVLGMNRGGADSAAPCDLGEGLWFG